MTNRESAEARARSKLFQPIVEAIPFSMINKPLDYILADHLRQRSVCVALRRFADAGHAVRTEANMVIGFLDRDLPLHHEDEDEDLFPAMRRRALPEDDLGTVLARLSEDHRLSNEMVGSIIALLADPHRDDPVKLDRSARELIKAYVASEHRHLAMENGIVMAIARIRLKATDLKAISQGMKKRRGVDG